MGRFTTKRTQAQIQFGYHLAFFLPQIHAREFWNREAGLQVYLGEVAFGQRGRIQARFQLGYDSQPLGSEIVRLFGFESTPSALAAAKR